MADLSVLKQKACEEIDRAAGDLHLLSKQIWQKPELAFEEHYAHSVLTDFLSKRGFQVEPHYKLDTAFRARHGPAGASPNIAVICEYDALPEIGHGCGHNLIAETGVAAALGIRAAMETSDTPLGQLTVLGTPGEECAGGKLDLIDAGAFTDIDAAIMSHPSNMNLVSPAALAILQVHATYTGKAAHASVEPWNGINALDACVLAYQNIACLRQQMKPNWRLHSIFSKGGVKPNIIPEEAELYCYLRTPTGGELKHLKKKVQACFEGAATATGCTLNCRWDPKIYTNVLRNKTITSLYKTNSEAQGVEFSTSGAIMGSTDMGNVSHVVPGIHPKYDIDTTSAQHTADFTVASGSDKAQQYAIRQGKILAMTALDMYCQNNIMEQIKQDFQEDLEKDSKEQ